MLKGYEIEAKHNPHAVEILKKLGLKNLIRMPRLCLYDFEAEENGRTVYIEVRTRSPDKVPYFIFRRSKLARLNELKRTTGRNVYILLMWRNTHKFVEIDKFPLADLKPINITFFGEEVPAFGFPVSGEITREEHPRKMGIKIERKVERAKHKLVGTWMDPETHHLFKLFAVSQRMTLQNAMRVIAQAVVDEHGQIRPASEIVNRLYSRAT